MQSRSRCAGHQLPLQLATVTESSVDVTELWPQCMPCPSHAVAQPLPVCFVASTTARASVAVLPPLSPPVLCRCCLSLPRCVHACCAVLSAHLPPAFVLCSQPLCSPQNLCICAMPLCPPNAVFPLPSLHRYVPLLCSSPSLCALLPLQSIAAPSPIGGCVGSVVPVSLCIRAVPTAAVLSRSLCVPP